MAISVKITVEGKARERGQGVHMAKVGKATQAGWAGRPRWWALPNSGSVVVSICAPSSVAPAIETTRSAGLGRLGFSGEAYLLTNARTLGRGHVNQPDRRLRVGWDATRGGPRRLHLDLAME